MPSRRFVPTPAPVESRLAYWVRGSIRRPPARRSDRGRNRERCTLRRCAAARAGVPRPGGHASARRRSSPGRRRLVHGPAHGPAGLAEPADRAIPAHDARRRLGAARSHRRPGRRAVDHRRGPQRDRPRRSAHAEGSPLPVAGEHRLRESQYGDLRQARRALVHGAERDLRPSRSEGRQGARVPGAARRGAVRHNDDADRRRLLRLARRLVSRSHRRAHRVRVAPGRTRAAGSGSASGTRAGSAGTTRGPSGGASGASPARTR
jgi:hypothetical protein